MRRLAGFSIYIAVALYITYSALLMLLNTSSKAHEPKKTREYVFGEKVVVTSTPSPIPTNNPTPSSKPTLTPTLTPEPSPTEPPVKKEQETQENPSIANAKEQSHKDYILGKINEYRASQGVSAASPNTETCSFARTRAGEIASNFNHDSFTQKISSNTLPYPSYSLVTENIAMTSNYQDVVNIWINSGPHAENMRKDTPFICVEQNGNYYAYEGWKP